MLFELDREMLASVRVHEGPPVWHQNAQSFLDRWTSDPKASGMPYIAGDRWMVGVHRENVHAAKVLEGGLAGLNLGKHINLAVKDHGKVVGMEELLVESDREILSRFLDRRRPWEI